MRVETADPNQDGVVDLLREHLADMHGVTPPGSVHALDIDSLDHPSVTLWVARDDSVVLGCVALKELSRSHGEIKSMRTSSGARNRGVASTLLSNLIQVAKDRGYQRLSLETGSIAFFEPARSLYRRFGFTECGPFADYSPDPNSTFMTMTITAERRA